MFNKKNHAEINNSVVNNKKFSLKNFVSKKNFLGLALALSCVAVPNINVFASSYFNQVPTNTSAIVMENKADLNMDFASIGKIEQNPVDLKSVSNIQEAVAETNNIETEDKSLVTGIPSVPTPTLEVTNEIPMESMNAGGQVLVMEATGYTRYDPGCGDYTATGHYLQYGVAAVDPDVIPLGTDIYVEGYGHAVALDTGGAIVGNRIDLAFDSREEAFDWGRRDVNVHIQ